MANAESLRITRKNYVATNRDKVNERQRLDYRMNKEIRQKQQKEYRTKNKDKLIEYALMRKYKITLAQYGLMIASQNSTCAICENVFDKTVSGRPHIDHDHITGRVRGLLCGKCNTGIGLLREDVYVLNQAKNYLETSRGHG